VDLLRLFRRSTVAPVLTRRAEISPFAPTVPPAKAVAPPVRTQGGGYTWSLETIRSARDAQLRGQFEAPVRLAEAFRTNDAMFTAYMARVSTQSAIRLLWRAADTDAGRELAPLAERLVLVPQHARESILGTLANHGVAIGYVQHTTEDDPERGPVVRMTLAEWPLEHVRYNPSTCTLETRTRDNGTVTITHGDGRWIVFRKFGVAPWTQDACLLPGALVWAAHGGCISDWAGASFSHGQPKVIGTLREGITLQNADGTLTVEAQAMLNVISALVSGDAGAGVLPAGSEAKLLYNGSTAWQVFKELGLDRNKAAQRVYLGTDAALGAQGGAPGVDIGALFNVASTRIQGDLEALERGFREGMIEPWARMHGFALRDLTTLTYAMPDADGERRASQEASGIERLTAMVKGLKDTGIEVNQDTINALVSVLGIAVPCKLAAVETQAVPLQLAPTDVARVVKVREARAAQGLPPLGDERDELTISALEAQATAPAAPGTPGAPPPEDEPPPAGGGAPAPSGGDGGAPPPRREPVGTTPDGVPIPFTRAVAAAEDDAEAEIENALREPIDGDGDGRLNEDETYRLGEMKVTRRRVEKALKERDKAREKAIEIERQKQPLVDAAEAAQEEADRATEEHDSKYGDNSEHASKISEIDESDAEDAEDKISDLEREARRSERKMQAAQLKAARLQRKVDKFDEEVDGLDRDTEDDLRLAVDSHLQASEDYTIEVHRGARDTTRFPPGSPELAARQAFVNERIAEHTSLHETVGSWDERAKRNRYHPDHDEAVEREAAESGKNEREARAIVQGPKGGRYYINEAGEKEYVE
jgi:hypothetical protein